MGGVGTRCGCVAARDCHQLHAPTHTNPPTRPPPVTVELQGAGWVHGGQALGRVAFKVQELTQRRHAHGVHPLQGGAEGARARITLEWHGYF